MRDPWSTWFCVGMGGVSAFQVAAAAGAPVGEFTQGGRHAGVLPAGMRVAAALSTGVCVGCAVVALDRAGRVDLLPPRAGRIAMWTITGFLGLNTAANLASQSNAERAVMTPISLTLALLAGRIASRPEV